MALIEQPDVTNSVFVLPGGFLQDDWKRYFASLDATVRASGISLAGMKPLPLVLAAVTVGGFLTPQMLAPYFRGLDATVRGSGWNVAGLLSLPPVMSMAVVVPVLNQLSQPWALYLPSLDSVVRLNA